MNSLQIIKKQKKTHQEGANSDASNDSRVHASTSASSAANVDAHVGVGSHRSGASQNGSVQNRGLVCGHGSVCSIHESNERIRNGHSCTHRRVVENCKTKGRISFEKSQQEKPTENFQNGGAKEDALWDEPRGHHPKQPTERLQERPQRGHVELPAASNVCVDVGIEADAQAGARIQGAGRGDRRLLA